MNDQATPTQDPTPAPKVGVLDYLKMLWNGRQAVELAIQQGKISSDAYHQGGIKSLAFWMAALSGVAAVAGQVAGFIPQPWGAIALAVSASGYAISRGLGKQGDPTATAKPTLATTEGLLNILAMVGQVAMAWSGAVDPKTAAILAQVHAVAIGAGQALAASGTGSDAAHEVQAAVGPEPKVGP